MPIVSRPVAESNDLLVGLLSEAFGGLEDVSGLRADISWPNFDPEGFFVAECVPSSEGALGCVAVLDLPRKNWREIRYLALRDASSNAGLGEDLLARALAHVGSKPTEYLKATTLALQPYVDLYKKAGFTPVRRTLRLSWNLASPPRKAKGRGPLPIRVLPAKAVDDVRRRFARGHLPYWDWWIEEQGGDVEASRWIPESLSPEGAWLGAWEGQALAGYIGFLPDFDGPGQARLHVFCVLPEFRRKGVGASLVDEALRRATDYRQHKLVIYTFSYLDCLAPGAITYLKSGARIEAEYLQLERNA